MSVWKRTWQNEEDFLRLGTYLSLDSVEHDFPKCGTVACLGGSVQCLIGKRSHKALAEALGITKQQASGLFYSWGPENKDLPHGWPEKFRLRFADKNTPAKKARVAVSLLKEVVRTNGECLNLEKSA
jgi:hypothetical protein